VRDAFGDNPDKCVCHRQLRIIEWDPPPILLELGVFLAPHFIHESLHAGGGAGIAGRTADDPEQWRGLQRTAVVERRVRQAADMTI
jgi:hypothetical protein